MFESERILRRLVASAVAARSGYFNLGRYKRSFTKSLGRDGNRLAGESFDKLKRVIKHSYETTGYYREAWDAVGFSPRDLINPEVLSNLPLLTKEKLDESRGLMVSSALPRRSLVQSHTGGSSGTPTVFYRDAASTAERMGRQLGILDFCGYRQGGRCAVVWGAHQDLTGLRSKRSWGQRIRRFASGKEILDCTVVTDEALRDYYNRLIAFAPTVLYGYPSGIRELLDFINSKRLAPLKVASVICTAERLTDADRRCLSEGFGAEVFNLYCSREHGCMAFECSQHNGLHIDVGSVHIEILHNGRPAAPGIAGDIVVTDLLNYGMPLIRYRIGDRGRLAARSCPCGCALPLLDALDGRVTDLLYRPDGGTVSGVVFVDLCMDMPEVKNLQIVQEDLANVVLNVEPGKGYSDTTTTFLVNEARKYLGDVRVAVHTVAEIERNKNSGKFQEVINKIDQTHRQTPIEKVGNVSMAEPSPTLSVCGLGDVSFAGTHSEKPNLALFESVMGRWAGASLVCANLEGPLIDGGNPVEGKCTLRSATGWAGVMKAAGITVISLANNHSMDYGVPGLESTMHALDAAGIKHVGAGKDRGEANAPLILDISGVRVGLLARTSVIVSSPCYASESMPGVAFLDEAEILASVSSCRKILDFLILLLHWGIEEHRHPSPGQRALARQLAGAGADLILGHHPHVVQGVERIGDSVIAYSLGNFVLDDFVWRVVRGGGFEERLIRANPENRIGAILNARLEPGRVTHFTATPAIFPPGGNPHPDDSPDRRREFERLSRRLRTPLYDQMWHLHAAGVEWKLRLKPRYFSGGILHKLLSLRPHHLRELFALLRRSARVAAGKTTNPYE